MKLQTSLRIVLSFIAMCLLSACGPLALQQLEQIIPQEPKDPPTTPPSPVSNQEVEIIHMSRTVTPINDIIPTIKPQDANDVKVCLYYKRFYKDPVTNAEKTLVHNCNHAKYRITLNDVEQMKADGSYDLLNLNNATARTILKEDTVTGQTDLNIEKNAAKVPGKLYTGKWKDNSFSIKANCKKEDNTDNTCHSSLMFYSFIGHVTTEVNGHPIDLYFTTKSDTFVTDNSTEAFEIDQFKVENEKYKLTTTKYEFDDYCTLVPEQLP